MIYYPALCCRSFSNANPALKWQISNFNSLPTPRTPTPPGSEKILHFPNLCRLLFPMKSAFTNLMYSDTQLSIDVPPFSADIRYSPGRSPSLYERIRIPPRSGFRFRDCLPRLGITPGNMKYRCCITISAVTVSARKIRGN